MTRPVQYGPHLCAAVEVPLYDEETQARLNAEAIDAIRRAVGLVQYASRPPSVLFRDRTKDEQLDTSWSGIDRRHALLLRKRDTMTDPTISDFVKAMDSAKSFLRKAEKANDGEERKGYLTIAKAKLNGVMRWLVRETGGE